ncbi:MAG: AAA family ATPase [Eubacterium sp.]|nr:AAA family ATPase [Eubacterium sp.]
MGIYVNPGNQAFNRICGSNYVDKSGLIGLFNRRIGGDECLVCISRPRRFGKSYAAKMLTAYYDCSCDSHFLFDDKTIAKDATYEEYINKYDVINLDITGFISECKRELGSLETVPSKIVQAVKDEILLLDPDAPNDRSLEECMIHCVEQHGGRQFIFIIDEWDAMIRETSNNPDAQEAYLNLLRGWFKNNNFTPKAVAAAYMTGILPIKKDGTQSAISEFDEYSMLAPLEYAKYVGFTETEVVECCDGREVSLEDIKEWYDGYGFPNVGALYNPYSVMKAIKSGKCGSYWRKTSAANPLKDYIKMDFDGLQEKIIRLIADEEIAVDVDSFQNDFESFGNADDVITLLIHLGYLTYAEENKSVRIPNEEVRTEFKQLLSQKCMNKGWIRLIERSENLINAVVSGECDTVASILEEIRDEQYAPQFYNNEQALRAIIKYAFVSLYDQYTKIEEMPSGKGIADVVFIPSPLSKLPAMVVELKWNKTSGGALEQIHDRNYIASLKNYEDNIVLVGINYDEKTGKHSCQIETM